MRYKSTLITLIGILIAPAAPALAATCLTHTTHERAGEAVSSLFGVWRNIEKSVGWHMGLDIVNSARGRGAIYAGADGTVSDANGGSQRVVLTAGDMQYHFLHMFAANRTPRRVKASDQIGRMGNAGTKAIHLHFEATIRGDALKAAGGTGRTFRSRDKTGQKPMTASAISAASPQAYYYINPEPFLVNQLPFQNNIGSKYADQIGGRRNQTLPRTCSPSQSPAGPPPDAGGGVPVAAESPKIVATTTQTGDAKSVTQDIAADRSNSEQGAATMAGQSRHGITVDLAKVVVAELTQTSAAADFENQARMEIALAHMLALKAERIGR